MVTLGILADRKSKKFSLGPIGNMSMTKNKYFFFYQFSTVYMYSVELLSASDLARVPENNHLHCSFAFYHLKYAIIAHAKPIAFMWNNELEEIRYYKNTEDKHQ